MRTMRPPTQTIALAAVGIGALAALRAARTSRYDFRGKSVLITGGSRGLGLVLARQLAGAGAHLTLMARDEEELRQGAENVLAAHPDGDVLTSTGDVRTRSDAARAVAHAVDRHGRIDVVINNAGVIQVGPLDHMTLADFEDSMNTHFWGPLHTVLEALPFMRRQGGGRIVNISSIGGRIAVPHMLPYCASKFALTGLSDGLRLELARDNIRVTSVFPGLMRTGSPLNATFKGQHADEYTWFAIADSLPALTIDAERAAAQILAACRRGDAELVITPPAKFAIVARTVAPELFAAAMSLVNQMLPGATGPEGNRAQEGRASGSDWASSKILTPTYEAAARNNEL